MHCTIEHSKVEEDPQASQQRGQQAPAPRQLRSRDRQPHILSHERANAMITVTLPSVAYRIEQLDWFLCYCKKGVGRSRFYRSEQHNSGAPVT